MFDLLRSLIIEACPYPTQDMLYIIVERGQNSDQIFRSISEESYWCLKHKVYTEEFINWNKESVLNVASVFKVRNGLHNHHSASL